MVKYKRFATGSYEAIKVEDSRTEISRQAKNDFRPAPSTVDLYNLVAVGIASITAVWIIFLTSTWLYGKSVSPCQPDGTYKVTMSADWAWSSVYNPFSASKLFQITLGFGQRSFSAVKLIDIVWDTVSICKN